MKKRKLLILSLFVCMAFGLMSMRSEAAETEGEQTSSGLQDENPYRLEYITDVDENGNVTEAEVESGSMEDSKEEDSAPRARALFRSNSSSTKVVNFNTGRSDTIDYTEEETGTAGYTAGMYGADAAYLGEKNGKVKFMMAGVVGWVDKSDVEIIDLSAAKVISGYEVENGRLLHGIVRTMKTPGYNTRLDNGPAPSYLKSGTKYYSYDGHYFYTNYNMMLSDYRNETRSHSVNPSNPYYNYYQYLPLRSKTSYSSGTFNSMLNSKAGSGSKMRNTGEDFISNQNTYGVNALLTAGIAANESAWGTSSIAKSKNNLFGLNAVDSSPGTSASTFASPEACIKDFARGWMSKGYLYPNDWRYYGGYLGNKAGGINVKYASDPYWGEKAANMAYALDKSQGSKDYGKYTIGIKGTLPGDHDGVNVRKSSSTSSTIFYNTGRASGYAVLIRNTKATDGFYEIQSDAVLDSGRTKIEKGDGKYNFDKMYAYISSDYVRIANKGGNVETKKTLSSISITTAPKKTTYTEGETFDPTGMKVTAKWSDGSASDVTKDVTYSKNALKTTDKSIKISYKSGSVAKTAEQKITVKAKVTVSKVSVDPSKAEVKAGESKTFKASVTGTGSPSQKVTWSVDGNKSSKTKIDVDGKLTVGGDETADELTVTAKSEADSKKSGQAQVTVKKEQKVLSSISITTAPKKTVYTEGETFDPAGMKVTAKWSDGSTADVTDKVTYSKNPLKTTDTGVTFSYASEGVTKTTVQKITVNVKVTVSGVTVDPVSAELNPGDEKVFAVAVSGTGNPSQDVTWSVSGNNSNKTVIDKNGKLTVGSDEMADTLKVKAVSKEDDTKSAEAAVTVVKKAEEPSDDPSEEEPGTGEEPGTEEPEKPVTAVDEETGIIVSGTAVPEGTNLKVDVISEENESYAALTDNVGTVLGVYDITLDKKLDLADNETVDLTFSVGEEYNDQNVVVYHYYTKKDKELRQELKAVVKGGKVTVPATGFSPYVVTLDNRDDEVSPPPNVIKATLESIKIAELPTKTAYEEGETFDQTGMKVTAKWSDGKETDVTAGVTYRKEPLAAGTEKVTVSYTNGEVTKTADVPVTVKEKEDEEKPSDDPAEEPGDGPADEPSDDEPGIDDPTDEPSDGEPGSEEPDQKPDGENPDGNKPDDGTNGGSAGESGTGGSNGGGASTPKAELDSIKIKEKPKKTTYTEGEKFDPAGMKVTAKWSDGSASDVTKDVTYSKKELKTSDKSVKISYMKDDITKTAEVKITVKEKAEPEIMQVTLDSMRAMVKPGGSHTFKATVTGKGDYSKEVVWTVKGAESKDTVIDKNGKLTVGANETAEAVTVKAVSAADETKSATATVMIEREGSAKAAAVNADGSNGPKAQNPVGIRTGDTSNVMVWGILVAAAAIAVIAVCIIKRRNKK